MSKQDRRIANDKPKKITASQYVAQQAQIVAQLIQSGKMPTLEQVQAAAAVARENLKKKLNLEDSNWTRPNEGGE